MNILLVKLSSLGDVLHNLPIVWDLRAKFPKARIDWVVDENFAPLLDALRDDGQSRGLDHIIPMSLRRWKKTMRSGGVASCISEFGEFRARLRECEYDLIIETQGLIKTAIVTRLARRTKHGAIVGLANRTEHSGYEPLARCFYTNAVRVPERCHAVDRSRRVAAAAVDAAPPDRQQQPPKFYPETLHRNLGSTPLLNEPYALCFHSTARAAKRWADANWVTTARRLSALGLKPVFPWGNAQEKDISVSLASRVPDAVVPEAFSVREAFSIVASAHMVIGVDTGMTHLAAILGRPTIELYCDSPRWKTEGYWSPVIRNLGDTGTPPIVEQVLQSMEELMSERATSR